MICRGVWFRRSGGEFLCSDAKEPKIAGDGHDETSASPPCLICCPPRTPEGNGSSAQDIPCVRRCRNRTVPASIRLPPFGDTIGSCFYRTKRLLQSSFRSHSAARHSWLAAKHSRFVRTAQQVGAECVVTRCRVSGNPLPVLHQKEDLRNHGFLSAFFVSFVARQKTPARGRNNPSGPTGQNSTSPQTPIYRKKESRPKDGFL